MDLPDQSRFLDRPRYTPPPRLSCDRGGPARPVGDVLAELLDLYRARFPELKAVVVQTPATPWWVGAALDIPFAFCQDKCRKHGRENKCRLSLRERTGLSRSERRQYGSY